MSIDVFALSSEEPGSRLEQTAKHGPHFCAEMKQQNCILALASSEREINL